MYFIFLHKFLLANDYFRILELCGIEDDVLIEKNVLNIYVILIVVPIH